MPKNKNILVTGGAGFIGCHLVEELIKDNRVTVVDDFSVGSMDNLKEFVNNPNLKVIKEDIRNQERMIELTKEIDIIYHMAVVCLRVSINNPMIVDEINSTGTLKMLIAAQKNNVKKFIYISSSEAYGSALKAPMDETHPLIPITLYGASKAAGELYTQSFHLTYGLPTVIVRPFNTYGPKEHFEGASGEVIPKFVIRIMNNITPVIFGDGEQTRDFTYVKDTVDGIIQASDCPELIGETVNIARGEEVSINRILNIVKSVLNKDIQAEYREGRPGDVRRHYADINKAKKFFNYQPNTSIEDGIKKYITWLKTQNIDLTKDKTINW
ncbi:MAG TPA: GDP-mannose 4,6-dehydratase [Candidatus Nanoarchaeia archaeon]|nr:GDP-mannose 4,6-dehydratase [Candidatus Nanoarchaeia archaeon]